jgi:hypothetical protein
MILRLNNDLVPWRPHAELPWRNDPEWELPVDAEGAGMQYLREHEKKAGKRKKMGLLRRIRAKGKPGSWVRDWTWWEFCLATKDREDENDVKARFRARRVVAEVWASFCKDSRNAHRL